MMKQQDIMARERAEAELACLREIFSEVRLLDKQYMEQLQRQQVERQKLPCQWHDFLQKEHQCDRCSSLEAFLSKKQNTKLEILETDVYFVISRYVEIDGEPYVIEMFKRLHDNSVMDTLERERLVNKLIGYKEKVYRDVLTEAYNRRYYEEELKQKNFAAGVAMLDLDDFKLYNDTYGHEVGDLVLKTTADVIRKNIRRSDMLIRYGGDEFLLILPDMKETEFLKKLKKIKTDLVQTSIPGYSRIQQSVSIGGVLTGEESIESAVKRADQLMYQAKNQKNMIVTENITYDENGEENTTREDIKQMILIVDDSEMNRAILSHMLEKDYRILEASNGVECLEMMQQYGTGISLVLLDIVMPKTDGFEVLAHMNREHWIEELPVVMISSEDSESYIRHAYELGVSDYISRPFDAKVVYQRVFNTIKLYTKQRRLSTLVTDQMYEKEKNNQILVSVLSQIVEFRNGESGLHVLHINRLTGILIDFLLQKTDRYPSARQQQNLIITASALHDIGKIGIDEKILNKPGKLTKEEFEVMKTHTIIGASMLDSLEFYQNEMMIKIAYQICRWHHERYDGRGYPDGLKGDEIPIAAQIVALADVYDALVSERVYKKAFPHEVTMQMILNGECGVFNPILMECLKDAGDKIHALYVEEAEQR